jgi:hypothetical protein
MSTQFEIITINYEKRKPSRAVIMRTLAEYLKQGGKAFEIHWGENCIDVYFDPRVEQWFGYGWIKEISGDDIARELNEIRKQAIAEIKQFKADHFQFIHIGG